MSAFEPKVLLAISKAQSSWLLTGYGAFVALMALAIFTGHWLAWGTVFIVATVAGWFLVKSYVELVALMLETLLPR